MAPSRPVTAALTEVDHDVQEQEAVLQILLATMYHYFGSFSRLFASVTDPRQPALIIYPLAALLTTGLFLFVYHLGARRQINHKLRGNQASAAKFETLFGVAQCPHGDTLEAAFSRLQPAELQDVVSGMTETLIRRTHRPTPPAAGTWASAGDHAAPRPVLSGGDRWHGRVGLP